jgi:hypothetical protein
MSTRQSSKRTSGTTAIPLHGHSLAV